MKKKINKLTYEKSGVSIKNADKLIGNISKKTKNTHPNVLAGIGGFSSLYALDIKKYKNTNMSKKYTMGQFLSREAKSV